MDRHSTIAALYTRGIGFYSLGSSFSYICYCLADGLAQLGVPVISNIDYRNEGIADFSFHAEDESKFADVLLTVVDPDQLDAAVTTPQGIQRQLPSDRYVLFSMSDTVASLSPPADHPFFCTHENRFYKAPGLRVPWAFGCSSRMINAFSRTAALERRQTIVANFRPSESQSVRQALELCLTPLLERTFTLDRSISDHDKWGANHFSRLQSSLGCLAYGGFFAQDLRRNTYIAQQFGASLPQATFLKDTIVLRWDSWRLWESLLAGCATIHLDFEKYGFLLPQMPVNGTHYIGIDLEDIPGSIACMKDRDYLLQVGEAGRAWALQHYSPIAVAKRFLGMVNLT